MSLQAIPDEIEATDYREEEDDVYRDPAVDDALPRLLRAASIGGGGGGAFGAALQMEVRGSRLALPIDLSFRAAAFEPEPEECYAGGPPAPPSPPNCLVRSSRPAIAVGSGCKGPPVATPPLLAAARAARRGAPRASGHWLLERNPSAGSAPA